MKNSLKGVGSALDIIGAVAIVISILSGDEYKSIGISTILPSFLIIAIGEICIGMHEIVNTLNEINKKLDSD